MKFSILFLLFAAVFYSSVANSHARWAELSEGGSTPARSSSDELKVGACGDIPRENDIDRPATVLVSGSDVTLKIYQSIYHQGDYRVYFSEKGDEDLFEFDRDNGTIINTPSAENTLIAPGDLPDQAGKTFYEANVTLPNITCDDCVLQLIQHMPDRRNPYYYSCADIILTTDGSNPSDPVDVSPPEPVSDFSATPGDAQVALSWTNPSNDFSEVIVLQSNTAITSSGLQPGLTYAVGDSIGEAQIVYKGRATNQIVSELMNGSSYNFEIYASDDNLNYSTGVFQSAELQAVSTNIAPSVNLIAEQDTTVSIVFTTSDGEVLVQASVADANSQDTHTYDWSSTSSVLIDSDNADSTFTFDPSTVDAGNYELTVNIQDNGIPPLASVSTLAIMVEESVDSDGDGVEDNADACANTTENTVVDSDGCEIKDTDPVTEDPVTEDPVIEDPVTEDPVTEDPVTEDPVTEDPVNEDPVTEDPVTEDPVTEDPVNEDPVNEDPVNEDPVTEDPVNEDPVNEDPVTEDPLISPVEEAESDSGADNVNDDKEDGGGAIDLRILLLILLFGIAYKVTTKRKHSIKVVA